MSVQSKAQLSEWCKRKLGDPVIEINVDDDQVSDRVDEALEYWREYHSDATYRGYVSHEVTQQDIDYGYITVSSNVLHITKLFKTNSNLITRNMFDIKYQMMLNDITDMYTFIGDLAYYEQIQQYLSLLDMKLAGSAQVDYVRRQNRLYVHGDFVDGDIKLGDFLVYEAYTMIDSAATQIWDDLWLKEYATALIKQQWGSNLSKFEGMQLPGGVQLNGQRIFEEATNEISQLREKIRTDFELPPDFYVG